MTYIRIISRNANMSYRICVLCITKRLSETFAVPVTNTATKFKNSESQLLCSSCRHWLARLLRRMSCTVATACVAVLRHWRLMPLAEQTSRGLTGAVGLFSQCAQHHGRVAWQGAFHAAAQQSRRVTAAFGNQAGE
jgi:hypothetical protein